MTVAHLTGNSMHVERRQNHGSFLFWALIPLLMPSARDHLRKGHTPLLGRPKAVTRKIVVILMLAVIPLAGASTENKTKLTREYDLKAAFLFNFTQFVEWPQETFPESGAPIVIGVLGDDPFGKSLDEIVANETVRDRKILVRRCRFLREVATCHVVFISRSEEPHLNDIFEFLDGKSVLTVGDSSEFSRRGGMIGFTVAQNKLQVKINVSVAKAGKLTISSKLLRQAEIVDAKQ